MRSTLTMLIITIRHELYLLDRETASVYVP